MAEQIQNALTILRRREVERRTGLSRSSIYERIASTDSDSANPAFPRPIQIGGRAVGWLEHEVTAWISAQIEKSRKA